MKTTIQKWGNSLAVRIPKAFALEAKLGRDSQVELLLEEGRLVIVPLEERKQRLERLLAAITPDNLHEEVDSGPPVGSEVW